MKRLILSGVAALALAGSSAAMAHVSVGVSIGLPGIVIGAPVYAPPPVYVAPPPPPPVVYAPAPVVVPAPVIVAPRPYPYYRPVVEYRGYRSYRGYYGHHPHHRGWHR